MLENSLEKLGYTIIDFKNLEYIYAMQEIVKTTFPCVPTEFHQGNFSDEERLMFVKQAKDLIVQNNLVKKFLFDNQEFLIQLLGPDIDIMTDIYLRVSRPNFEGDFIDWHRDTFYGNSLWELNFWMPIFPLENGAGLALVEGSHLKPASNVQSIQDENEFRTTVTKGSLANELGYLYAPKIDDTIINIANEPVKLLSPKLGQAVLFFTHVVHRAQNASTHTRVSIDLRIKNMFAPTNTKPGYFQPLVRSAITNCVEKMLLTSA
jgi:hypothetical protein